MNIWDIVICAVLAVAVFFAIRSAVKQKKKGGCCGNCSDCQNCGKH